MTGVVLAKIARVVGGYVACDPFELFGEWCDIVLILVLLVRFSILRPVPSL